MSKPGDGTRRGGEAGKDRKPPVALAALAFAANQVRPAETAPEPSAVEKPASKKESPFSHGDWRMVVDAWATLLVRVVLILGAVFSVYQYLATRQEQRVAQTTSLVELWEQPDYQKAQQAVKNRLAALNAKYQNLLGADATPAEEAIFRQRIGIEAMTANGGDMPVSEFSENFDRVVYFLNRLSFCVEGNLCAREVADAYFRDYAVSFWSYFSGYADKQRKAGSTNFAQPIENYVGAGSPAPTK